MKFNSDFKVALTLKDKPAFTMNNDCNFNSVLFVVVSLFRTPCHRYTKFVFIPLRQTKMKLTKL